MLVSLAWLKKYVEIPVDVKTLVNDLTMTGLNVEKYTSAGFQSNKIVIGDVLEVAKHPNADNLSACRVRVGDGMEKGIVCGAANIAAGQKVPVALIGAVLPGGMKIKKSKIRGMVSEGMICSETELGLGRESSGIMVLSSDAPAGTPFAEVLSRSDTIIEIEVTPNRPDLLSHTGVAREIAAIYKVGLKMPGTAAEAKGKTGAAKSGGISVKVSDTAECSRYVGRIIKGVKVGPSPSRLKDAIESVGLNSVNNIVDITNYVMMELGQPLHAFDMKKLRGSVIGVERARPGQKLLALNGETYELTGNYLAITDDRGAIALAGIIGGMDTAVDDGTADIFLESACFDPVIVRKTSKDLNLATEASYRFERGTDRRICALASERACEMIIEAAGGKCISVVDEYGEPLNTQKLALRGKSVSRLLGVKLPMETIKDSLERLEFACDAKSDSGLEVTVPSFRPDIHEEADLIEEVARIYGYNRIGESWDYRCTAYASPDEFDAFTESLLDYLAAAGFCEVVTTSFTTGKESALFSWPASDSKANPMRLKNPMNSELSCMRTSLLPGMIDVVRRNMDQGQKRLKICQAGKIFLCRAGDKGLPDEKLVLCLLMTKPKDDEFWSSSNKTLYLHDIKSVIEAMSRYFRIDLWHGFCYAFDGIKGVFDYSFQNSPVIEGGIIPGAAMSSYDFDQPVWYANIDIAAFYKARNASPRFAELPEYPVSKRDLSLLAVPPVRFEDIEKSLAKTGGGLIESLKLFDVYKGDKIPEGAAAYGIRIHFRSREKTLTDSEIDKMIEKMLNKLRNELGVLLRS